MTTSALSFLTIPTTSSSSPFSVLTFSVPPPIFHQRRASSSYPYSNNGILLKRSRLGRVTAASGDILPSETLIDKPNQIGIVPPAEDGSNIVSALLFIAFAGLSVLTVGVIYIAVQDFLQKRERDKFEKEEAAKKKKSGKKVRKVRARAGPRGFGQKIEEEDE